MNIWAELGIAPTRELRDIKRAYAVRLKQTKPEQDPQGFQRLRAAYEAALAWQARPSYRDEPVAPDDDDENDTPPEPVADDVAVPPAAPQPAAPAPARPPLVQPAPPGPALHERPPDPLESAVQLCQHLLTFGARDWPRLITEELHRPGWERLDFQQQLQRAILHLLLVDFDRYERLVDAFVRHYQWDSNRIHGDWMEPRVRELQDRNAARQWRYAIESDTSSKQAPRRKALELLRSGVDERANRRWARYTRNQRAMNRLLAELQGRHRRALQAEIELASARWWHDYLGRFPAAWDRIAWLAVMCVVLAPVLLAAVVNVVDTLTPWQGTGNRWLAMAAYPVTLVLVIGLEFASRAWMRAQAAGRFDALAQRRDRWRNQPQRRRAMIALTTACVLLSVPADTHQGFLLAAAAAVLLAGFWYSTTYTVLALLINAWPMHFVVSLATDLAWRGWPWLGTQLAEPPRWVFPHLAGFFLVLPAARLFGWLHRKLLRRPAADEIKQSFYAGIVLCVVLLFVVGALSEPADAPRSNSTAPVSLQPLDALIPGGLGVAGPPQPSTDKLPAKHPPQAAPDTSPPPPPRDAKDVEAVFERNSPQLRRLFDDYSRQHPVTRRMQLVIGFMIGPDGDVTECHLERSDFKDKTLEDGVVRAVKQLKFGGKGLQNYLSSGYTFTLTPPKPADAPPAAGKP